MMLQMICSLVPVDV